MPNKELATLTLNIAPEALREIVAEGRLLEFTHKLATEAAAQISAQVIDHVAAASLKNEGLKSVTGAQVSYIIDGGDFGTHPPRPHFGVGTIGQNLVTPLRQVAAVAGES
jgi:hypothetical protein